MSIKVGSRVVVAAGDTAYLRLANFSYNLARVSLGGLPFLVVASDGRPLRSAYTASVLELDPGERYDILFRSIASGTRLAQVDYVDNLSAAVLGSVQTEIVVV